MLTQKQHEGLLLYDDNHGTNLTTRILENVREKHSVIVKVKPCATLNAVVENIISDTSYLQKDDHVVIIGGGNDMYKNKSKTALDWFQNILPKLCHTNVIVANVPVQYDLPHWFCVNKDFQC